MKTTIYTTPLKGNPIYVNSGIIKVIDSNNNIYSVGEISYEKYDDKNYQYVITPYWDQISLIPSGVFDGIPGIGMDIKKDKYYRVNMTPSFIINRTPSESREDLKELLNEVGLDHYDRFEWLLRSNKRSGVDNFIVVRKDK